MTEYISSLNNSTVKKAASLFKKSARDKEGLFLIEGDSLVLEAIGRGTEITSVFVCEGANIPQSVIAEIEKKVNKVYVCTEQIIRKISELNTPPAIIACAKKTVPSATGIKKGCYILLEDIQDPGNMGAVIRSAAAFGIDGVVVSGGCDIYSGKVIRGSMGASLWFNVYSFESTEKAISCLKAKGNKVYAAVLNENAKPIGEYALNKGTVVAIGNEGNGLAKNTIEMCNSSLYIPISEVESLNAAVCASICIWEMKRNV